MEKPGRGIVKYLKPSLAPLSVSVRQALISKRRTLRLVLSTVCLVFGAVEAVAGVPGEFEQTGSMINGRAAHGAAWLFFPNGKVLVAGGNSGTATELYDTASGIWSPTGSLGEARYSHTFTLLSNNNVLVTGGFVSGTIYPTAVASAELYNTSSGTWTAAGSVGERGDHTATWLLDGKVLVAGGHFYSTDFGDIYRDDAILYDVASGNWSATGSLLHRRAFHTATLLGNGKVLVAGGFDSSSNSVLATAELYDPATGTWSATGNLTHPRQYHTATLLHNGMVLVAGGSNGPEGSFAPVGTAELYDPATGTWTTTGSLADNRAYHTATLLGTKRVLVTGGSNGNSTLASAELYDPATGSWKSTGSLREPRSGHTASYTPYNQILLAGGGVNDSRSAELYTEPLTPPDLLNISTRLRVQNGDNAMIGGFIIRGIEPKPVIMRGMGPSLKMPGALQDPVIELRGSSGELLATNDNWRDSATRQQIINSGLAPTYDSESALWRIINPGSYTVVVRGKDDASGIGLFEVYDLDRTADSSLANVSTRGVVQTGDDVMIGGIIFGGGSDAAKVVVRAIGPSLPMAGTLPDPTLELRDRNGTLIAFNDDWKKRPDGSSQQAEIEATTIPPSNDLESAVVQSLVPNAYTAIVRGKDNSTGIGLVEVFNLR